MNMGAAGKVGGLVVLFAALFFGVLAVLQTSVFKKPMDTYWVLFDDAGGLSEGAPVFLSGVQVGNVQKVSLAQNSGATITLNIDQGVQIPQGTVAVLPGSFISLGDRQLHLKTPAESSGFISPDNESNPIAGVLESPMQGLLPDADKTIAELNNTLIAVQGLLNDQELKDGVKGLMAESEATAQKFGHLATTLDSAVGQNAGKIAKLMDSVAVSLENLQAVSLEVRKFAEDGDMQAQVKELMTTINSAAKEGEEMVRDLHSMTSDPELQASLKNTLKNFESMSDSGTRIAADAEVMSKNGIAITDETKTLLEKANKVADEISKAIEEIKGRAGEVLNPAGGVNLFPELDFEGDLIGDTRDGNIRTDIGLKFPIGGGEKVTFGLYDAFESNKLNLMLERPVNPALDLRYGVYASKVGVGVSYRVAPGLSLRSELFGLNDPRWDIRFRYQFSEGFHGWGGLQDAFGRTTPVLGIGIRR
ncbi:MAG: MCE family protein [Armatimonadetes bacterium]|nr:MCE family protein [Armatimonadota bacterium]